MTLDNPPFNIFGPETVPPDAEIGAEWNAFIASVQCPQAQERIRQLMEAGLKQTRTPRHGSDTARESSARNS
ncbi:MAG: hypothetical protein AAAB11_08240, partial [Rhizobium giardinii]